MSKTTILIVDDEEDVISTLRFRLENTGYEVLVAENGAQALETLRQSKVDLILADFMMPEINGLELARLVKANPNWFEVRIILFSCNTDPEFRRRALELGATDYLPKTEGYGNIIQRVSEVTASPEPPPAPATEKKSDEKESLRTQLSSLSRSLVDMLRLAQMSTPLPESAKLAIDSAQKIAEDILQLSGPDEKTPVRDSSTTTSAMP